MNDPAARQLAVPVAASRGDGSAKVGMDTGAGVRQVRRNPLEHDFDEAADVLSAQLVVGRRATKITSGEYAADGRLVAGDLSDLVAVVQRVRARDGTVSRGGPPTGRTGVSALRGDGLIDTTEGLARLDGVFTSGGYPRSEYDAAAQAGEVPGAIDALARVGTWRAEGVDGWAMPLRIGLRRTGGGQPSREAGVGTFQADQGRLADPGQFVHSAGTFVVTVTQTRTGETVKTFGVPTGPNNFQAAAQGQALAYVDLLNSLADAQRKTIDALFAAQQKREAEAASGQVLPATDAQVRRYRAELDRINESLAALGANVSGSLGGYGGEPTARSSAIDATASRASARVVEVWGSLDPYDLLERDDLSEDYRGRDPESYQDRARLAPHFLIDLDKLLGDDRPPPPFPPPGGEGKKKPPENPPPSPWPPKPKPGDGGEQDDEDEEDVDEQLIDGAQRRIPYEDPDDPRDQPEDDSELFVPGQDTFVPGTGLPDPGSTMTGEVGTGLDGKLIKGCPLGDDPEVGWVPSPTGIPAGAGAAAGLIGGGVGGIVGVATGGAGGAIAAGGLTPGQAAALVLEDGSQVDLIGGVPSADSLTDAQKAALADMVKNPGVARVPSPVGVIGDRLSIRGWGALVTRQLNAVSEIVQAALVGGRYSHYQGNLGIVSSNVPVNGGKSAGINDQFIGQHLVDPDDTKPIPAALEVFQALSGKTKSVTANRPGYTITRSLVGDVTAATALVELRKRQAGGATDTGAWIGSQGGEFEIQDDGRGHFAGGLQSALEPDVEALVLSGDLAEDDGARLLVPSADGWWDVYNGTATLLGSSGLPAGAANHVAYHDGADWTASDSPTLNGLHVTGDVQIDGVLDPSAVAMEPQATIPANALLGTWGVIWSDTGSLNDPLNYSVNAYYPRWMDGNGNTISGRFYGTSWHLAYNGLSWVHEGSSAGTTPAHVLTKRLESGTPADGIGVSSKYYCVRADATTIEHVGSLEAIWTDVSATAAAMRLSTQAGGYAELHEADEVLRLSAHRLELPTFASHPSALYTASSVLVYSYGGRAYVYDDRGAVEIGSGGGSSLPVTDTTAVVKGSVDATKLVAIEADTNVPTGTTVTLTAPGSSGTLLIDGDVGTTVQAWDDDLDDIAALTHAARGFMVSDGTDWTRRAIEAADLPDLSGTYQPLDADLTAIAGLSPTKGNLIVGNGTAWVAVGVGTDGYSLVADSAAAAGVAWDNVAGGGGSSPPFSDATALVKNASDATKLLGFDLAGLSTATQVDWTVQNASGTVPLLEREQTWTALQYVQIDDSGTSAYVDALVLRHMTSGTPAAGFGVSLSFELENSSPGTSEPAVDLVGRWADPTNAAEDGALAVYVRQGGAMVEALEVTSEQGLVLQELASAHSAPAAGETALWVQSDGAYTRRNGESAKRLAYADDVPAEGWRDSSTGSGTSLTLTIPAGTLTANGQALAIYACGETDSLGGGYAVLDIGSTSDVIDVANNDGDEWVIIGRLVRTGSTSGRFHGVRTGGPPSGDGYTTTHVDVAFTADWSADVDVVAKGLDGGSSLSGTVFYLELGAPGTGSGGGGISDSGSYTPTGSWTTNTSYAGYYHVRDGYLSGMVRVSLTGAPDTGQLKIAIMPSGWELDVSRFPGGSAAAFHNGSGTIFDTSPGAYSGRLSLTWDTVTEALVWHGGTSIASVTRTSPVTLASGDSIVIEFHGVPVVAA